jgi:DNA-binding IclR family transcriptional regulator
MAAQGLSQVDIKVIQCLASRPCTVTDVSQSIREPPSVVAARLAWLDDQGYVRPNDTGDYELVVDPRA